MKNFLLINIFLVACIFIISLLFIFIIFEILIIKKFKNNLEYEKKSYDCLSHSYDGIREFKHDFSNIMQSIGGYLITNDLSGLKIYYSSVFKDCKEINKLECLGKGIISSPPILSLISEKYEKAHLLSIDFNINILTDPNLLDINIYEFTRILGIFLDNSIEAACLADKKFINIIIANDSINHFNYLIVENSFNTESEIDTREIFEKNFSTKPRNSGIGLWKVKKIINKYDNIDLETQISNNIFSHKLKIHY